jgi:hypothetical protein
MAIGFNEIQVEETALGEIVILVIKGKLSKEDYDAFVPQLDWLIEKKGTIKLLVELVDFQGWTAGALWEDTKFALKHMRDISKLALVGEGRQWEKGMIQFMKPFTKAKIQYFESGEKEDAKTWLVT